MKIDWYNKSSHTLPWLYLALFSIAISGVFSILIVALRTPYIQTLFPFKDFFSSALVIHVDMSVLVWMLAISGIFISIDSISKKLNYIWAAFALLGTILIAASPFAEHKAILNNYIPVIDNLSFIGGFGIFLFAIVMHSLMQTNKFIYSPSFFNKHKIIATSNALLTLIAFISLAISRGTLNIGSGNYNFSDHEYYELLFWGFGHILQFLYMNLLICYIFIVMDRNLKLKEWHLKAFAINLWINVIIAALPLIEQIREADITGNYVLSYTEHMKYFGGIPIVIAILIFGPEFIRNYRKIERLDRICIMLSLFMIGVGGILGFMIHSVNVTIPAHYHGTNVGITLALMGFSYFLLKEMGFTRYTPIMYKQLIFYSIGQMMHILGLAWSGGYGALRKNHGEIVSMNLKVSMGFMGLGGLIAIIAGLTFFVIMLTCMVSRKGANNT